MRSGRVLPLAPVSTFSRSSCCPFFLGQTISMVAKASVCEALYLTLDPSVSIAWNTMLVSLIFGCGTISAFFLWTLCTHLVDALLPGLGFTVIVLTVTSRLLPLAAVSAVLRCVLSIWLLAPRFAADFCPMANYTAGVAGVVVGRATTGRMMCPTIPTRAFAMCVVCYSADGLVGVHHLQGLLALLLGLRIFSLHVGAYLWRSPSVALRVSSVMVHRMLWL